MMMIRSRQLLIRMVLLFASMTSLVGCGATSSTLEKITTGPVTEPLFIDVDNFRGNVKVYEQPRLNHIEIRRSQSVADDWTRLDQNIDFDQDLKRSLDLIQYTSNVGYRKGNQPTLRIQAVTGFAYPDMQRVDLHISVPSIAGVQISTQDGKVEVINGKGPVSISTSNQTAVLSTVHPVHAPISIHNANGHIDVRIPTDSDATLDLHAIGGQANINDGGTAAVRQYIATGETCSGVIGHGQNLAMLQTSRGNIRVLVHHDPSRINPLYKYSLPVKP